jgi:hypothetical protein
MSDIFQKKKTLSIITLDNEEIKVYQNTHVIYTEKMTYIVDVIR